MGVSMRATTEAIAFPAAATPQSDRRYAVHRLTTVPLMGMQLTGLFALNFAGNWFVGKIGLPLPGNLVGMLALFLLLWLGVVRMSWLEPVGPLLIRHLAFFFVPITVGLMSAGPLFAAHGIAILVVLSISAAIGIVLAGGVSQLLLARFGAEGTAS